MRYFYKIGIYKELIEDTDGNEEYSDLGWDWRTWKNTGQVKEVNRKFYFEELLPLEEKIKSIKGTGHHFPFKIPNRYCQYLNII